ncbi:MAG: hypothetical protein RJA49_154 [Actinomycetota bacterium]|jgi:Family of unknown function (DUF6325)
MLAPVEYVLIGFPYNDFTGGIAPAIADLSASGLVRIIDLVFISKDLDGTVTCIEYDELPVADEWAAIDGDADGFLHEEDILDAAEGLDPNSSALLIVWEDLWAARLGAEIVASGGILLRGERIPHQVVAELLSDIETRVGELS